MDNQVAEGDRLFLIAESLARTSRCSKAARPESNIRSWSLSAQIARQLELLNNLDIDSYIESVLKSGRSGRIDAPTIIRAHEGARRA
jgi:hypothetical protein